MTWWHPSVLCRLLDHSWRHHLRHDAWWLQDCLREGLPGQHEELPAVQDSADQYAKHSRSEYQGNIWLRKLLRIKINFHINSRRLRICQETWFILTFSRFSGITTDLAKKDQKIENNVDQQNNKEADTNGDDQFSMDI